MSFEKYFRDELDYLRQLGRDAAIERPHLAAFLSEQGSDPDVERLLEGFAFLTGNLREKIDDQFPELTHGLLNMLWPNYLRPVPSMTIIEYTLDDSAVTQATLIERGTQVLSVPIAQQVQQEESLSGPQCTFRLCRDLWLFPMAIRDIYANNSNEQGILCIDFASKTELNMQDLQLNKLRFYLGEDYYTSTQLYFWISHYFERAELMVNGTVIPMPDFDFAPVGFARKDALLPYTKNAYMGYRILQEYFCFPEGFLFFDVTGIVDFPPELNASEFTLKFYFSQALPPEIKVRSTTLRLNCTPAVNLFERDSEAIELDGTQAEYPLRASYSHADHFDIFSVDSVDSWLEANGDIPGLMRGRVRSFTSFESFHHQVEHAQARDALYYRLRVKNAQFHKGFDHFISFVRSDESRVVMNKEIISIGLTCTNREWPLLLRVGDINQPTKESPSFATFRNITRPSVPLYPVIDGSLHWSLLSNMSLNYMSLLDKDALKQILHTYDFPSMHSRQSARASQRRLDAIERIETQPVDRLFRGLPVRGLQTTLWLEQSAFSSEGELYLFSTVLAHFFSLYASVNAFHLLKVTNLDNQECYEWPVQTGQHALM
ncbi:type VI secretion system baseplate subunit TssF [Scandinavium lactucae]|uniref:Type VI secretion system baseplate subunit TssF n=1 Tax=Scandinavium lactucae TaxID=3095028 RepID=A0ABU4QPU0_9ENTR|nr:MULTISPECIES: type VI secretion system baseplate subunit TssF [unclassified Scandinavium]MDX6040154.1 type VI secretion system baseplate subunit TssF [Scandinavium sp. V105_6]MDX6051175.1 type VI secretion system baseplate subunit TssF [Scandinavium sp. V105_1]